MKAGRLTPLVLLAAVLALPLRSGPPTFKNVILFIGDGMSEQSEIAASRYLYGRDRGLAWHALPGNAYVATWDVSAYDRNARQDHRPLYKRAVFDPSEGYDVRSEGTKPQSCRITNEGLSFDRRPATDSASAATALATGFKTASGRIAWLPGDNPHGRLTTIEEEVRARRKGSIGIVTTVPFNHATPASFVSHNTSRSSYYTGYKGYTGLGLADEIILKTKPDVVIGGGHPLADNPSFDPKKGYVSEPLLRALRESTEYVLAERKPGVSGRQTLEQAASEAAVRGKKLFGLFGAGGGNFTLALPANTPGAPSFSRENDEDPEMGEAVVAALTVLSRNPNGFFLMAEQGDVDWANHDNDFRGMIGAVADLDRAVRAAVAFVDRPGDDIDWTNTILLVTADHATGGLCLNPGRPMGAGVLPKQIPRGTAAGPGAGDATNGSAPRVPKAPAFKSPYLYPDGEVTYATIGHSNELVNLAVTAPGASLFVRFKGLWYPGPIIDNTQINAALRDALGLDK